MIKSKTKEAKELKIIQEIPEPYRSRNLDIKLADFIKDNQINDNTQIIAILKDLLKEKYSITKIISGLKTAEIKDFTKLAETASIAEDINIENELTPTILETYKAMKHHQQQQANKELKENHMILESTKAITYDQTNKFTNITPVKYTINKNGEKEPVLDENYTKTILKGIITDVTEIVDYVTTLEDIPTHTYKIQIKAHNGRTYTLEGTIEELRKQFKNETLIGIEATNNQIDTTIGVVIDDYKTQNPETAEKLVIKEEGFYEDTKTGKLVTVGYNEKRPNKKELKETFAMIKDHGEHKGVNKTILAEIIRYSLIAPWFYICKQNGGEAPYIYLHGKARSGKTKAYATVASYIYNRNVYKSSESGAANSKAQLRYIFSKSTFPTVLNDFNPHSFYKNQDNPDMLKYAFDSLSTRHKQDIETKTQKYEKALSSVIFTSNYDLTAYEENEALERRYIILELGKENQVMTKEDMHKFNEKFKLLNNKENRFKLYRHLGSEFYHHVTEHEKGYKIVIDIAKDPAPYINKWLKDLQEEYLEIEPLTWLEDTVKQKNMQEIELAERQEFIELLKKHIGNETRGRYYRNKKDKTIALESLHVEHKLNYLARKGDIIPFFTKAKRGNFYQFTKGISQIYGDKYNRKSMKGIADLMGWKLTNSNGKRHIKVSVQNFLKDIYNIGERIPDYLKTLSNEELRSEYESIYEDRSNLIIQNNNLENENRTLKTEIKKL